MRIRPRRILWPTDLSDNSLKAAQYAQAFREAFSAKLFVLNVASIIVPANPSVLLMAGGDAMVTTTDTVSYATDAVKDLVRRRFKNPDEISVQILTGSAWSEICRYAKEKQIDLIVMATHGRTGLSRLFIGSTAERVVQHAPCPVLTVKNFEHEFLESAPPAKSAAGRARSAPKQAGPTRKKIAT